MLVTHIYFVFICMRCQVWSLCFYLEESKDYSSLKLQITMTCNLVSTNDVLDVLLQRHIMCLYSTTKYISI